MTTLTITIEGGLEQEVKRFANRLDLTREEATVGLLRRSIDLRKPCVMRRRGRKYAQQAEVGEEEDIFEAVQEW